MFKIFEHGQNFFEHVQNFSTHSKFFEHVQKFLDRADGQGISVAGGIWPINKKTSGNSLGFLTIKLVFFHLEKLMPLKC